MKKEFYKLVLVMVMMVASFSLAFFLGRKVALTDPKLAQNPPAATPTQQAEPPALQEEKQISTAPEPSNKTQREIVQDYTQQLPDPKPSPLLAVLVQTLGEKEKAMEYSTQLKLDFPEWPVFFKKAGNFYKVYLGPFENPNKARIFLNEAQESKRFSSVKLTEIVRSKK